MTDIQELCRRVVIIDHGKIFFDGKLSEIIDRFADVKIVTISWQTGANPPSDMAKYGVVVSQDARRIELKIKRDQVVAVCKQMLDQLPVSDIDIQDLPIEDVIRQIFAR
jgi:ABC-2 type transport system ATP-binding protein